MKRKLLLIDVGVLRSVASNFGISADTKEEVATKLTEYLRGYGYTYKDLEARFPEIKSAIISFDNR